MVIAHRLVPACPYGGCLCFLSACLSCVSSGRLAGWLVVFPALFAGCVPVVVVLLVVSCFCWCFLLVVVLFAWCCLFAVCLLVCWLVLVFGCFAGFLAFRPFLLVVWSSGVRGCGNVNSGFSRVVGVVGCCFENRSCVHGRIHMILGDYGGFLAVFL